MNAHQVILVVFALAVVAVTVLIVGRLGWCTYLAVVARRYGIAAKAVIGIVCLMALLFAMLAVWFILAVSHMQKDINDTYTVMALTGIPYFLASYGLWRLAARFRSNLRVAVPHSPSFGGSTN